MTATRSMFAPLVAAGESNPTWLAILLGLGSGIILSLGAFITARFGNRDARAARVADKAEQDRKAAVANDASVQVARVKAEESERARVFQAWQANEKKYAAEALAIRSEMERMRRTFGHEVRNIQQYISALQDLYHALHAAALILALQCRIMRARLKRHAESSGEKFDEEEFPPVDMETFDPKLLPKYQPTNGWDEPTSHDKKTTGRLHLPPDP